jgi:L-rhamnose mutarotase
MKDGIEIERSLVHYRLRPESIEYYLLFHANVWPELIKAYHEAGITEISCFLKSCDLFVFTQSDPGRYLAARSALANHPVEIRWQALMHELHDPKFEPQHYKEVYRMPSGQAGGDL